LSRLGVPSPARLRSDLLASGGAGRVGFIRSDVGAVARTVQDKLRDVYNFKDFGADADGIADDYDAVVAAHNNVPDGSTIVVSGRIRIATPVVWTRPISIVCPSLNDFFIPDLLTTQDAIRIVGGATMMPMVSRVHIFGGANCCQNGLVMEAYHRSKMRAIVSAGGSGYSFQALGCIDSQFALLSSVNFFTPLGGPPQLPPNHLKIERYNSVSNNGNDFWVIFDGQSNGIIITDQAGEGNSAVRGTIEGLSGAPISAVGCNGFNYRDVHGEGNSASSAFTDCSDLAIENVQSLSSGPIDLYGCVNARLKNYTGGLTIDAASKHTRIANMRQNAGDVFVDLSTSTEIDGGIANSSTPALSGGPGASPMENLFHNPYCAIWSAGVSAAPDGFTSTGATFARNTSTVYGLNPRGISVAVTSTAVALADAVKITPAAPFATTADKRWVAIMVALYVPSGQIDLIGSIFNGTTVVGGEVISLKNGWSLLRAAAEIDAGATPYISLIGWDGAAYAPVNYYIGGVVVVNGTTAPKYLCEGPAQEKYVTTDISQRPSFLFQKALVGGVAYIATGISVPGCLLYTSRCV